MYTPRSTHAQVLLDTIFNVSLLVAIMLTTPLFCSLATIMIIPVRSVRLLYYPSTTAALP